MPPTSCVSDAAVAAHPSDVHAVDCYDNAMSVLSKAPTYCAKKLTKGKCVVKKVATACEKTCGEC